MTLLLFHHGNSFESIYQSSSAIRRIALKIKSRSFHQFTAVYEDREKSQAVWAINFKWLSKHAAATLTASLLTPDLSAYKINHHALLLALHFNFRRISHATNNPGENRWRIL